MKSIKKILLSILLCVLIVCTIGFVGCKKTNLTVENFNDVTVTAGYNSNFSLAQYLTAVDSNGKAYKGEVSVKDIDGNDVEVSFNNFAVNLKTDYTATITVTLDDGTVVTRTVLIQVVDMSLPKIAIGELYTGVVGEQYLLPEITTSKAYGQEEITTTVKVYYIDKISMDEQTIADGKFTPEKPGNYKLVIDAVDTLGNKNVATESFYVRSKMSGEILEDFTDSLSAENVRSNSNSSVWFNTVTKGGETKNGVVKVDATNVNTTEKPKNGNENYFYVKFNRALTMLETIDGDFDYLSVKLYVETEQAFENNQINLWSWAKKTSPVEVNKWQEVKISKEMIMRVNGSDSYWSADYYSDKKGHTNNYNDEMEYFWNVHADDGINTTSLFQIKGLTSPLSVYFDEVALVRIDVEDYQVPFEGDAFKLPLATLSGVDGTTLISSTANSTQVTFKAGTNATPEVVNIDSDGKISVENGEYNVKYNLTVGQNTYIKEFNFIAQRKPMADNMLEDFDSALSLSNLWNANAGAMSAQLKVQNVWYSSYENKTGVASVNGYGNDMRIRFNRTAAELKALGLDENDTISVTLLWTTTASYSAVTTTVFGIALPATPINTWKTYDISIADIISANTDLNTFLEKAGSDGAGVQIKGNIGQTTTLYVAEITFTKN